MTFIGTYILKGKLPVPEPDILRWGEWLETADTRIALTVLEEGFRVSTVFLGLDHNPLENTPMLFETMTFRGESMVEMSMQNVDGEHLLLNDRYSNWNDAEKGHARIVVRINNWLARLTPIKIRPSEAVTETNRETHDE